MSTDRYRDYDAVLLSEMPWSAQDDLDDRALNGYYEDEDDYSREFSEMETWNSNEVER